MSQIGTLNEKSLHAALKRWIAQPGDQFEVPLQGSVIDIIRDGELIEIQTRQLGQMKRKLKKLLPDHAIRVVHPIAAEKWVAKYEGDPARQISRRKSPKKGTLFHVFGELVRIPSMIEHPNFTLEVLMIQEEEWRVFDPKRMRRRRRGWVTDERHLLQVLSRHTFTSAADLAALLPDSLPDPFDTAELAAAVKQSRRVAQQIVYTLRHTSAAEMVGKRGNAHLYHLT